MTIVTNESARLSTPLVEAIASIVGISTDFADLGSKISGRSATPREV